LHLTTSSRLLGVFILAQFRIVWMAEDTVLKRFRPSAGAVCRGTKRIVVSNSDNRGLIVSEAVLDRKVSREMAVANLIASRSKL
jgi:hypothetical protein